MRYSVTLERGTGGGYLGWVHELPGCFARAATREEVERELVSAIAGFLEWAGRAPAEPVEIEIVTEVESAIETMEDTEVLLEPDRAPLTRDYWSEVEALLERSRTELLDLLPASSRTLREQIVHIAFVELMYAAWTFDHRSIEGLTDFLEWTRAVALARMRALAEANDGAVTYADWAGAPRPEEWTARKAARRLVWHELLHLPAIRDASRPS